MDDGCAVGEEVREGAFEVRAGAFDLISHRSTLANHVVNRKSEHVTHTS